MSNTSTSSSSTGGVGLAGLLLVAFIVLKLTHVIDWSWWWVLAPAWIPFGLVLGGMALFAVGLLIRAVARSLRGSR
jgi:phosphoglycerol transferase MdoB-like AlkP superfamily enzyme